MDTSLFQKATNMLDDLGNSIDSKINNLMIDIDSTIPGEHESFSIRLLAPNEEMKFLRPKGGTTVGELQQMIEAKTGVAIDRQRLVTGGKSLSDPSRTLRSLSLTPATTIHLFPRPAPSTVISSPSAAEETFVPSIPSIQVTQPVVAQTSSPDSHTVLSKYLMLMDVGVSRTRVIEKMKADGVDPSLLPPPKEPIVPDIASSPIEVNPFAESPTSHDEKCSLPVNSLFSSPLPDVDSMPVISPPLPPSPMAKYELMVSIGISRTVVKLKMESEGMSPSTIEAFLEESYPEDPHEAVDASSDTEEESCVKEEELHTMMQTKRQECQVADLQLLDALISHTDSPGQDSGLGPTRTLDKCLTAEFPESAQNIDKDEWGRLPGPPQLMIMNSFICPVCLAEGKLEVSFSSQGSLIQHYEVAHRTDQAVIETIDGVNSDKDEEKSWLSMFDSSPEHKGKYRFSHSNIEESNIEEVTTTPVEPREVIVEQIAAPPAEETPMNWVLSVLGLSNPPLPQVTAPTTS